MTAREEAHALIERIPDGDLPILGRMLRGLVAQEQDPVLAAIAAAPMDDEPYTEEEQREDEAALAEYRRGSFVSHDEVLRRMRAPVRQAA